MRQSDTCTIVEVGPRDGLQNEPAPTSVAFRVELINRLSACRLKSIETGSFVSPRWVPKMAHTDEVMAQISRTDSASYIVLVPNLVGLEAAIAAKASEIAIFVAASESFSQANLNCSIDQSFERFSQVAQEANLRKIPIRGYVSCVAGCPYEGAITASSVVQVVERLLDLGCYEISLGDTIGVGTPTKIVNLLRSVAHVTPIDRMAVHFHDTYGQALANILAALEFGISIIDSSIGGLGGCPYAKGATGNVATEEVVYMLDGLGVRTDVNLDDLIETTAFVADYLGRPPTSKVACAMLAKQDAI